MSQISLNIDFRHPLNPFHQCAHSLFVMQIANIVCETGSSIDLVHGSLVTLNVRYMQNTIGFLVAGGAARQLLGK
ncbi:hypothetical protein M408DRAFT_331363 [Serendipita vermifera MAFF 305830]|uniref:Uncharacterized protein n=1 Tax=Serendipita vermifera MAFF 305830 TaxID=933852 RepID=A0A0C3B155_SERVB|nr:hypothetical protein M408DRAFT_334162 [Serendipita vermifera MAFF 305830]KIM25266.1 hypothetical protein M408DRAFT_331363 [Serendipita vermifera MAFF 305830]